MYGGACMAEINEKKEKSKEVDIMSTAVRYIEDDMTFARGMSEYIAELKKQQKSSPEKSQKDARDALRRTGVTTEKGVTKDKIVSWE